MEWLDEEWDGEIKVEKRKTEETANTKQKRRKIEPLVGWGDKLENPAPCVRTWLVQDSIQEDDEEKADWRLKVPSIQQTPSQKLRQMEWDSGERFREEIDNPEDEITTKKAEKAKTGKMSKNEMKEPASKLSWGKVKITKPSSPEQEQEVNLSSHE